MVKWQQWSVDAFYHGCKNLGCKVIWSIKQTDLVKSFENDPNFWISPWVPQAELLAHPALRAGLTHGGFGGTLEFISAGIPVICFPHFGDQPFNTKKLAEKGVGIPLFDPRKAMGGFRECHPNPLFDSKKVEDSLNAIFTQQSYKQNMVRLQLLASQHGGRKLAADTIELVAKTGGEQLVDFDFHRK